MHARRQPANTLNRGVARAVNEPAETQAHRSGREKWPQGKGCLLKGPLRVNEHPVDVTADHQQTTSQNQQYCNEIASPLVRTSKRFDETRHTHIPPSAPVRLIASWTEIVKGAS